MASGPKRAKIPSDVEAAVLIASGRRCCMCFSYAFDFSQKPGQIAHIDRDPSNADEDNLVFLCLPHHSEYDSKSSQHKNYTQVELKKIRTRLYESVEAINDAFLMQVIGKFSVDGEVDGSALSRYEAVLQKLFSDPTLRIKRMSRGSIVFEIATTAKAFLTAAEVVTSDEFTERVGKLDTFPKMNPDSVLQLVRAVYLSVYRTLGDTQTAAIVVGTILTEHQLVDSLDRVSENRLEAYFRNYLETLQYTDGADLLKRIDRLPLGLKLVTVMSVLAVPLHLATEELRISSQSVETYFALGQLIARAGGQARAMSAGAS
jgi:hypothetical protein